MNSILNLDRSYNIDKLREVNQTQTQVHRTGFKLTWLVNNGLHGIKSFAARLIKETRSGVYVERQIAEEIDVAASGFNAGPNLAFLLRL